MDALSLCPSRSPGRGDQTRLRVRRGEGKVLSAVDMTSRSSLRQHLLAGMGSLAIVAWAKWSAAVWDMRQEKARVVAGRRVHLRPLRELELEAVAGRLFG